MISREVHTEPGDGSQHAGFFKCRHLALRRGGGQPFAPGIHGIDGNEQIKSARAQTGLVDDINFLLSVGNGQWFGGSGQIQLRQYRCRLRALHGE